MALWFLSSSRFQPITLYNWSKVVGRVSLSISHCLLPHPPPPPPHPSLRPRIKVVLRSCFLSPHSIWGGALRDDSCGGDHFCAFLYKAFHSAWGITPPNFRIPNVTIVQFRIENCRSVQTLTTPYKPVGFSWASSPWESEQLEFFLLCITYGEQNFIQGEPRLKVKYPQIPAVQISVWNRQ